MIGLHDPRWALLGFDLSTQRGLAVLARSDGSTTSVTHPVMTEHLAWLIPAVHKLMSEAGMAAGDLGAVAVGRGPGSFTGVRTAVMTAKAMAHVLKVPLVAPSTLDVLAAHIRTEGDAVCACIDARRGELYYGIYVVRGGVPRLQGPRSVAPPEQMVADCREFLASGEHPLFVTGNGVEAYPDLLKGELSGIAGFTDALYPGADELAGLAARMLQSDELEVPLALTPMYVRMPDSGPPAGGGCLS